jgi:hypothetical protein
MGRASATGVELVGGEKVDECPLTLVKPSPPMGERGKVWTEFGVCPPLPHRGRGLG